METGKKPISGWTRSIEKSMDKFDREDMTDQFRHRPQRLDALTEKLGCTSYYHKMRWPWLMFEFGGLKHPLEVDRYYHEIKLAIDFGQIPPAYLKVKELLLEENKIKYVRLENAQDLKSLALGLS